MTSRRYGIFVLTVVVVFGLAFVLVAESIIRDQVFSQEITKINTQNSKIFLDEGNPRVMFGDSRAGNGGTALTEFNIIWKGGQSVETLERRIEAYVSKNRPDRVIVQISPDYYRTSNLDDSAEDLALQGHESLLYALEDPFRSSLHTYVLDAIMSFVDTDYKADMPYLENGSHPINSFWNSLSEAQRAQMLSSRIDQMSPSREVIPSRTKVLAKAFTHLERSGGTVCVAVFPLLPEYADRIELNPAYLEIMGIIEDEANRSNFRFVDFSREFSDTDLFKDADHLNADGGMALGPRLEQACFD